MTLAYSVIPDAILAAVAVEALVLSRGRPVLRPVAWALFAFALLAGANMLPMDVVRRVAYAGWAGVVPALAWRVWGSTGARGAASREERGDIGEAVGARPPEAVGDGAHAALDVGKSLGGVGDLGPIGSREGGGRLVRHARSLPPWARCALVFLLAALLLAAARELPSVASWPESLRRRVWGWAYLSLRVAGLGVAVAAWRGRRPRTVAEALALVLVGSALVDVVPGIWIGDPWKASSWQAVALPVAGVTWAAVGCIMGAWALVTKRRGGS